jgi:hypothetical protein
MKLVGERRALAAVIFAFYFLYFLVVVLVGAGDLAKAIAGIATVYGMAFFSLVAGYFWARWYALGVGLFGVIFAILGMWQGGTEPPLGAILMFYGGTHLAATLMLWGDSMAKPYDGQEEWRKRWHMDDNAVQRLGRSVIRAGVSLPFVLLYALGPKPNAGSLIASIAALVLAGLGTRAIIQLRTWGVMALAAAGVLLSSLAALDTINQGFTLSVLHPAIAGVLLLAAAAPFALPMIRWSRLAGTRSV